MRLARVNSLLLIAILVVDLYIVVTPFVPAWFFAWERHHSARFNQLSTQVQNAPPPGAAQKNWLIVPSMLLSQPINEGKDLRAARSGPWRLPSTSTPDKGGNTVIIGHRFTYTNPRGVFYELDKVRVGDEIGIYWQAQRYRYRVVKTEVVPPAQTNIEAPTKQSQLTLYTCTPLWWPKNRLVVIANLEEQP